MEYIKEFFNSESFSALFASIVAFLSANALTIILFVIKYIKLKGQEMKQKSENDQVVQELTAKYQADIEKLDKEINTKLDEIESIVIKKVVQSDANEKASIENETKIIEQAIAEVKKEVKSLDDIINE